MSENTTKTLDTEQHWQELHSPGRTGPGDILKSAVNLARKSPMLGVGGAALAGYALGKILLPGKSASMLSKVLAATALPVITKKIQELGGNLPSNMNTGGKHLHRGLDKVSGWVHSFKH